MPQRPLERVEV